MNSILILAALLLLALPLGQACASSMVGPDASIDGSAWVGQSDDGEGAGDQRLVWVEAADWPAGSQRPVVNYGDWPRFVGTERKVPAYFPSTDAPNRTNNIIGYIDQVPHTFGFFEGNYAISNEHGLSFGESTCSAKTFALPKPHGPALFSMYELSRLAAERTRMVLNAQGATSAAPWLIPAVQYITAVYPDTEFYGSPQSEACFSSV